MPRFKFSKLVRDKVVEHQIASGAKPSYRILSDKDHKKELVNKIIEEANEILGADAGEVAAEIADVQQAIDDLSESFGLSDSVIRKAQDEKSNKNGTFKKAVYVDYVEIDEDDEWVSYYRKHPDRYPEVNDAE